MKKVMLPVLGAMTGAALFGAEAKRPNVILIMVDDMGWGDLGCYPKGAEWGEEAYTPTPNIDALAKAGTKFTQAYATCMVSSPSRAAMMTGRYQQSFGFYEFEDTVAELPAGVRLMPELLKGAGYKTGMVGKWHVSTAEGSVPWKRGFDYYFGFLAGQHEYFDASLGQTYHGVGNAADAYTYENGKPVEKVKYLTEEFTDRAIGFLERTKAEGAPFFLYVAYNAPHTPMQVPWEFLKKYVEKRVDGKPTSRDIARAMIECLDVNVGRLTERLKELGLEKDTMVIFTSDNGGSDAGPGAVLQHNGGLKGRKSTYYEGGVRVPFIMKWPGRVAEGAVFEGVTSHMDVCATALGLAGVEAPKEMTGVDLMPFLSGEKKGAPHERLFWTLSNLNHHWAVREGNWKLILEDTDPATIGKKFSKTGVKRVFEVQLYDLAADPLETKNLIKEKPEVAKRLRGLLDEFVKRSAPQAYTEEVKARHRAMLAAREKDPALKDIKMATGGPGHWFGGGAEERLRAEGVEVPVKAKGKKAVKGVEPD